MAADGTIRQVFDDIVEMIYERGLPYDKIGDGRILRLIAEAENSFCELTGVFQTEVSMNTVADTYDYTLSPGGTKILVLVEAIKYNGLGLNIRPYQEGSRQPSFYKQHYQEDGVMIAKGVVRLLFNPVSGSNYLTWFFCYAPGATYTELTGALVVTPLYYPYLIAYVMWKLSVSFAPTIAHLYEKDFLNGVRIHGRLPNPDMLTAKPIKGK